MNVQKYITFVKKKMKIYMWKIKNVVKLQITVIIQENIEKLQELTKMEKKIQKYIL